MTMTHDYSQYVRPERWPIPVNEIGYLLNGRNRPNGLVEIRCIGDWGKYSAGRVFVLDEVPREHVDGAIAAILTYRTACSKLIG